MLLFQNKISNVHIDFEKQKQSPTLPGANKVSPTLYNSMQILCDKIEMCVAEKYLKYHLH